MGERPGRRHEEDRGPVGTALATSVRSNATAFGFSITITVSFGALQRLEGSPTLLELLVFGVAAAVAIGALEGAITRGFRSRIGIAPPEVSMLGTALNFASVAAGVGAVVVAGELIDGTAAWVAGGFVASAFYILTEAAEVLVAIRVQRARGDVEADEEQA